jgi:molybdenum transport protein
MCVLSDDALLRLLEDDVPCGDLTTLALGIGRREGSFEFRARQPMRLCGVEEATRLCLLSGITVRTGAESGEALAAGQLILTGRGGAASLHRAWKTAQVLIEWTSGIASGAAEIVAAAKGTPVACTRKNAPGTKALAVKAVRAGGATMHRLGLSETVLVFPEHALFLSETPAQAIARLRSREPEKKLVVEVADTESALLWAAAGADVLQFEKFSPQALAACRRAVLETGARPLIVAAGGVRADNAAAYADAGADLLVTSAPYQAAPRDVAVTFSPS